MTDEKALTIFRESFLTEANQLRKELMPFRYLMRRHPSIIRLIMKTEHLTFSAEEEAILLGRERE